MYNIDRLIYLCELAISSEIDPPKHLYKQVDDFNNEVDTRLHNIKETLKHLLVNESTLPDINKLLSRFGAEIIESNYWGVRYTLSISDSTEDIVREVYKYYHLESDYTSYNLRRVVWEVLRGSESIMLPSKLYPTGGVCGRDAASVREFISQLKNNKFLGVCTVSHIPDEVTKVLLRLKEFINGRENFTFN